LQCSGKAQRLECARLLAARYEAVSPDCDQPGRKYELACTHARPERCGRRYPGRDHLFAPPGAVLEGNEVDLDHGFGGCVILRWHRRDGAGNIAEVLRPHVHEIREILNTSNISLGL